MADEARFADEHEETADASARGAIEHEHVKGITRQQWNYWHSHPVTRLMREYLRDYAEQLGREAMERWLAGTLVLSDEHAIRNRMVQIGEIEKLAFENVKGFYEEAKE